MVTIVKNVKLFFHYLTTFILTFIRYEIKFLINFIYSIFLLKVCMSKTIIIIIFVLFACNTHLTFSSSHLPSLKTMKTPIKKSSHRNARRKKRKKNNTIAVKHNQNIKISTQSNDAHKIEPTLVHEYLNKALNVEADLKKVRAYLSLDNIYLTNLIAHYQADEDEADLFLVDLQLKSEIIAIQNYIPVPKTNSIKNEKKQHNEDDILNNTCISIIQLEKKCNDLLLQNTTLRHRLNEHIVLTKSRIARTVGLLTKDTVKMNIARNEALGYRFQEIEPATSESHFKKQITSWFF